MYILLNLFFQNYKNLVLNSDIFTKNKIIIIINLDKTSNCNAYCYFTKLNSFMLNNMQIIHCNNKLSYNRFLAYYILSFLFAIFV